MPSGFVYKTIVNDTQMCRPTLDVEIWSNLYIPPAWIYSVKLTQLASYECGLDDGRFLHYFPEHRGTILGYDVETLLSDWFEERLTWIAANVHNEWSFDLEMPTVMKARFRWSFVEPADAVLFKLTF